MNDGQQGFSRGQSAYVDTAVLIDAIGTPAKVKILAVLLGDHARDLNASDISRMAGINRSTFYEHIDVLEKYELVEQTRVVGNSKMYQINKDSEAAKAFAKFEWNLLDARPDTDAQADHTEA